MPNKPCWVTFQIKMEQLDKYLHKFELMDRRMCYLDKLGRKAELRYLRSNLYLLGISKHMFSLGQDHMFQFNNLRQKHRAYFDC